jgi:hypothetical protein
MSNYSHAAGYLPEPCKITPTQAVIVSQRFAHKSKALQRFAQTRTIANYHERLDLLNAVERLSGSVERGPGHCLNRAALSNLGHFFTTYRPTKNATRKQKDYAHV